MKKQGLAIIGTTSVRGWCAALGSFSLSYTHTRSLLALTYSLLHVIFSRIKDAADVCMCPSVGCVCDSLSQVSAELA